MFTLRIIAPPGVKFTQWPDGSIQMMYSVEHVVNIRRMLLDNVKQLHQQAITKLEAEREAEIAKQRMPLTKLQQIQRDMNALQREMKVTESEHFDIDEIRSNIEAGITAVTTGPDTDEYPEDAEDEMDGRSTH